MQHETLESPVLMSSVDKSLGVLKAAIYRYTGDRGASILGEHGEIERGTKALLIFSETDAGRLLGYSPLDPHDHLLILETNNGEPSLNRIYVPIKAITADQDPGFNELDFVFSIVNGEINLASFNPEDRQKVERLYAEFLTKLRLIAGLDSLDVIEGKPLGGMKDRICLPHIISKVADEVVPDEKTSDAYMQQEVALLKAYDCLYPHIAEQLPNLEGYMAGQVENFFIEILPKEVKAMLKLPEYGDLIQKFAPRRPVLVRYSLIDDPSQTRIIELTEAVAKIIECYLKEGGKIMDLATLSGRFRGEKNTPAELARLLRVVSETISNYCGGVTNNQNKRKTGLKIERLSLPLPVLTSDKPQEA